MAEAVSGDIRTSCPVQGPNLEGQLGPPGEGLAREVEIHGVRPHCVVGVAGVVHVGLALGETLDHVPAGPVHEGPLGG